MRKNIFSFLLMFVLSFIFFSSSSISVNAKEETIETYDKGTIAVWAVSPTFYKGTRDVIVYSSSLPSGTHVDLEEVYIDNNGWSLFLGTVNYNPNVSMGECWAVASASGKDLTIDPIAQTYVDTDPKSIYPDLEDKYASYILTDQPNKKILGYIQPDGTPVFGEFDSIPDNCNPVYEGTLDDIYVDNAGIPQFFCFFGETETFPQHADEAEATFVSLMKKYIDKKYNNTSYSNLFSFYSSIGSPAAQATGHFDDFYYFYNPIGVPLYDYMIQTNNVAVQGLAVGKVEESLDWIVREFVAYSEGLPSVLQQDNASFEELEQWYIKETWSYKVKDWGWDFFIDTRNLARDENGYVCEDVRVTESSTGKLLFPALGDEIPEDLPGYVGILDTHPSKIELPEISGTPEQTIPNGESNFEVFPEDPEKPTEGNRTTELPKKEEPKRSLIIPIVILLLFLFGTAITVFIYKRKKK